MITHRCEGSWKAGISIRYEKGWSGSHNAWQMWRPLTGRGWDATVLISIAEIHFCPFCGQKLEVPKEKTSDER